MVDDLYFWYCVEGVVICHEGTDAFSDVTYLAKVYPETIMIIVQRESLLGFPVVYLHPGK